MVIDKIEKKEEIGIVEILNCKVVNTFSLTKESNFSFESKCQEVQLKIREGQKEINYSIYRDSKGYGDDIEETLKELIKEGYKRLRY